MIEFCTGALGRAWVQSERKSTVSQGQTYSNLILKRQENYPLPVK